MDVTLTIAQGPASVRRIRLRSPETIVGREKGCDLRIPSAEVSRRHCLLSFASGQLIVEDLDSSNGTYVNQVRVQGRAVVHAGDRLKIGPLTFTVEYTTPPKIGTLPDTAASPTAPESKIPSRSAKPAKDQDLPIPLADEPPTPPRSRSTPPPLGPTTDVIPFGDDPVTEENAPIEFDDSEPLRLPEGENFRDFLSQMEE